MHNDSKNKINIVNIINNVSYDNITKQNLLINIYVILYIFYKFR
jgi:hypothetical protein